MSFITHSYLFLKRDINLKAVCNQIQKTAQIQSAVVISNFNFQCLICGTSLIQYVICCHHARAKLTVDYCTGTTQSHSFALLIPLSPSLCWLRVGWKQDLMRVWPYKPIRAECEESGPIRAEYSGWHENSDSVWCVDTNINFYIIKRKRIRQCLYTEWVRERKKTLLLVWFSGSTWQYDKVILEFLSKSTLSFSLYPSTLLAKQKCDFKTIHME